ncbi:MAG: vanadium-dependent haloperoxidase [Pseudomonadota bacterium]|nr:vanadium-dependent haloperoxidase [Pseudomonadota bacterium]
MRRFALASRCMLPILFCSAFLILASCGHDDDNDVVVTEDVRDPSVARLWIEILLEGIRNDFARPTVHARNLHHISSAMYDAWAVYSDEASPYLLGDTVGDFTCNLENFSQPQDIHLAREEAISYAAFRLILYRFRLSPDVLDTEDLAYELFANLGYQKDYESTDYTNGSPAALGNYIADCYINYGLQDGSNERDFFKNIYYEPVNPDIRPFRAGNPDIEDLDRWQPISLPTFIDQSGNLIDTNIEFLSPEWGQVIPFALTDSDKTTFERDGFDYEVYFDPGAPPYAEGTLSDLYKWGFELVSIWSSHLDPADGVMIDISPASLGNPDNASVDYYPPSFDEYDDFYDLFDGGDPSSGYTVNPITGAPYEPQMVPRGDYARVLAEFWADGPDSETPPGHWYVIVNEINDNPQLEKRLTGAGPELGPLEWDVKLYFTLGGAMHDSAIAAWGIKGWYDYIRPLSALRAMAETQSTDPMGESYSPNGISLYPGYVELVETGDPLAGAGDANVGKIKLLAWAGPQAVSDPETDTAGVEWILAERWWPYQRPSFVTPPFAGYISGHSTYSRAAAEVLTEFTGSPYFPGGKSGFEVEANEFLVFEDGPSVDMQLEWATYRDASDQCSLSRIWGGIHPPADDIPGRLIGREIGLNAFTFAEEYW